MTLVEAIIREDAYAQAFADAIEAWKSNDSPALTKAMRDAARIAIAVVEERLAAERDRDAAEGGDANAAPVPKHQQARPEGIAHE